jgi:hypothetical protein
VSIPPVLEPEEARAILHLGVLEANWPKTLTMIAWEGEIVVVRTADYAAHGPDGLGSDVIQSFPLIPADGATA